MFSLETKFHLKVRWNGIKTLFALDVPRPTLAVLGVLRNFVSPQELISSSCAGTETVGERHNFRGDSPVAAAGALTKHLSLEKLGESVPSGRLD